MKVSCIDKETSIQIQYLFFLLKNIFNECMNVVDEIYNITPREWLEQILNHL